VTGEHPAEDQAEDQAEHPAEDRLSRVRDRFDAHHDYDAFMQRVVPRYEEMLDVIRQVVAEHEPRPARAVDLGVGTGAVTERLLGALPELEVVGVDFSGEQLERASGRLAPFGGRVTFARADIRDFEAPPSVDVVVSALAVHHLDDADKQALFARLAGVLPSGGLLVLADAVALPPRLQERAEAARREWYLARRWEACGPPGSEEHEAFAKLLASGEPLEEAHHDLDRPAPISDQVAWLERAGFAEAAVLWQHFDMGVIAGIR
jgi:tRNA (cmo5U34)-methyltransferase